MLEIMGTFGLIGVLAFILLVVIMPISVYAAQKWACKCYREIERTNELLAHTNSLLKRLGEEQRARSAS